MAEDTVYEVEVRIRSATDEIVKQYEAPLRHASVGDVAVDIKTVLDSRSGNRTREIDPSR